MTFDNITRVVSIDIALLKTGFCEYISGETKLETISPPKGMKAMDRINWLLRDFLQRITDHPETLTIIEGLSFASNMSGHAPRVGLHYLLTYTLWCRKQPYVEIAPTMLKKFVAGKGNAKKDLMLLETFKRFNISLESDDQADALGLNYIGRALAGLWLPTTGFQLAIVQDILAGPKPKKSRKKRT